MAGFTNAQPNLTDQELTDNINMQPPLSNGRLKNILLQNSPLSDAVLIAMLNREPALPGGMIEEVLFANSPLSEAVLISMLNLPAQLPAGNLSNVLIKESPLSTEVLAEVSDLATPLPGGTIENIVASNPLSVTVTSINVNCFGGSDGAIDLTAGGGIPPYTFNWSNGALTEDLNNITAGEYQATVTDDDGRSVFTSIGITEPGELILNATVENATCNGGRNGAVFLHVSGGTLPYTYSWSFDGRTTRDIANLPAGSYTVTITDAHACTAIAAFEVTEPPPLDLSSSITEVSCHGGNNGSIDLAVSGSSSPYLYNWSNGMAAEGISYLSAGNYTVTITDSLSCITISTFTISEPEALSLFISNMNISCNGADNGSIDIAVTGGTEPYAYAWSNGETTQDLTGLSPGTYTVSVTDAHGCFTSSVVNGEYSGTVTEPEPLLLSTATANVSCHSDSTGSIDLSVTGGVTPYAFHWSNGNETEDIGSLTAGSYTVTVIDANSCLAINSSDIAQPTAMVLSVDIKNISCHGGNEGSADLTVSGGISPYSFLWTGGSTTEDISGKTAGSYTVSVTDANSCTVFSGVTVSEPAALQLSAEATDAACFGANNGSVNLTVSGGTFPYSYRWSDNSVSEDPSGLAAGSYSVTVTDYYLCTATTSAGISQPGDIILSASLTGVSCNGGNDGGIDLSAAGSFSPFTYYWHTGAVTEDISGMAAGNYTVTVTDASGCQKEQVFAVTQPDVLTVLHYAISASSIGGSDGAILLVPGGGTKPYQYLWSNGATTKDAEQLTAGAYSATVTDAHGCTAAIQDNVGEQSEGAPGIYLRNKGQFAKISEGINLKVYGDVSVESEGRIQNNGNLKLTGDWVNHHYFVEEISQPEANLTGSGTVEFFGENNQKIRGTRKTPFHHLALTKTANGIDLLAEISVSGILGLGGGILRTSDFAGIILKDNSTVITTSSASFISGPMIKEGDDPFTFILGDAITGFHPLSISAPATASAIKANYFGSAQTVGSSADPSLETISNCEYWTLSRQSGEGAINVTLGWNENSCNTDEPSALVLAAWNGMQWEKLDKIDFTLGNGSGSITGGPVVPVSPVTPITIGRPKGTSLAGYATLKKKLDGSYYTFYADKGMSFQFDEEYKAVNANLKYKIIKTSNNTVVLSDASGPQLNTAYGNNRYTLNLCDNMVGPGMHILEVTNQKGEKRFLRFLHEAPVSCQ